MVVRKGATYLGCPKPTVLTFCFIGILSRTIKRFFHLLREILIFYVLLDKNTTSFRILFDILLRLYLFCHGVRV